MHCLQRQRPRRLRLRKSILLEISFSLFSCSKIGLLGESHTAELGHQVCAHPWKNAVVTGIYRA
jgi:hypothetical protein